MVFIGMLGWPVRFARREGVGAQDKFLAKCRLLFSWFSTRMLRRDVEYCISWKGQVKNVGEHKPAGYNIPRLLYEL